MLTTDEIKLRAKKWFPKIQEIRRHIHQHPELSFKEYNTSAYIANQLKSAGIEFTSGHVETGIIALIKGKSENGPVLLLRADMDALPIQEKNDLPYRSVNNGIMHACGHDVHSACVLGAALILHELRNEWEGTIKVMFQPGEEVLPGGANLMIKGGVLENPKVDKAIALHVFPEMEAGKAGFRNGMYMASTDELYLSVKGKGGHAAMPAQYKNPLLTAAEIILEIQKTFMIPGALDSTPGKNIPTVVAFGNFEAKGATNVIPEKAELAGTFRTMNETWRNQAHLLLKELVNKIALKNEVEAELRIEKGYPYLVNDPSFTTQCKQAAEQILGQAAVEDLPLRMTAEDFAFISQQVPSCFFRLGTGNKLQGVTSGVHTPTFMVDESALLTGTELLVWLSLRALRP